MAGCCGSASRIWSERYNKALKAFGLPETVLEEFRIDMTGFSPEIAEELG
jgi:hypothetical protein